jgi:RNA polymerase sigma-70 factor (ECF subfamily)
VQAKPSSDSLSVTAARPAIWPARVVRVTEAGVPLEYSTFFRQEFTRVTRTVVFIVHDQERAEDIAQDAFVQLLRNWDRISAYERPEAWVRRIAIRLAMRQVRRDRLLALIRRDVRPPTQVAPRDLDVLDAVRRLPGMQRAAVTLFYFEDRTIAEIADLLGCAEPTARVHLHRARKRLAELLGEEAGDAD